MFEAKDRDRELTPEDAELVIDQIRGIIVGGRIGRFEVTRPAIEVPTTTWSPWREHKPGPESFTTLAFQNGGNEVEIRIKRHHGYSQ